MSFCGWAFQCFPVVVAEINRLEIFWKLFLLRNVSFLFAYPLSLAYFDEFSSCLITNYSWWIIFSEFSLLNFRCFSSLTVKVSCPYFILWDLFGFGVFLILFSPSMVLYLFLNQSSLLTWFLFHFSTYSFGMRTET